MSKKHVDEYYNHIIEDYRNMLSELHDMEEEANHGLISPTMLDSMKQEVKIIKTNFDRISFIMYLFNQPNKREKRFSYERENKKKLNSIGYENTEAGIREENQKALNNLKNSFK